MLKLKCSFARSIKIMPATILALAIMAPITVQAASDATTRVTHDRLVSASKLLVAPKPRENASTDKKSYQTEVKKTLKSVVSRIKHL